MPPENPPRFNYAEPVSITAAGELETIFRAYRGNAGYLQKQENNHSGTNEEARSANWSRRTPHGGGSGRPPRRARTPAGPTGRRGRTGPGRQQARPAARAAPREGRQGSRPTRSAARAAPHAISRPGRAPRDQPPRPRPTRSAAPAAPHAISRPGRAPRDRPPGPRPTRGLPGMASASLRCSTCVRGPLRLSCNGTLDLMERKYELDRACLGSPRAGSS